MIKNLFKLLIVVLMVSMTSESFAQTYRVKAGLNLSTMIFRFDKGAPVSPDKLNYGLNLGATAEFPINDLFSFETGLLLSYKGAKMDGIIARTASLSPLYLEIPLNIKETYKINGGKVYGAIGPYLGIGIYGIGKYENTTEKIVWGTSAASDLKPFDFGLSFSGGFEIDVFQLGLNYGLGLVNIANINNTTVKNKVIGITIGYKFD